MAVVQLASQADVESALGRVLTSEESAAVEFALDKASEMFRRESGQQFTAGGSTVRLKVNGGRVCLPQHPVTSVTSVLDDAAEVVEYEHTGQWLTVDLSSARFVTVTYEHGGETPDLVRMAVAEVAARALSVDPAARSGVSQFQEVSGPFSENRTFAAWAVGGQVLLSPEDKALARSYKEKVPTHWVMRA